MLNQLTRGLFKALKSLSFLGILSAAAAPRQAGAEARPNIVFIFADDWGWGDLSCHGHPFYRTPNLDRMVAQGVDFHQFAVCNPVCSASRTAAMTGQFPARYSVHQHFAEHQLNRQRGMPDWLDPKATTLPRLLQTAGYRTGHFGKWHLTHETIEDAPPPSEYGFDEAAVFNGPAAQTTYDRMIDDAITFIRASAERAFYVNVWLHETHTPHYPTPKLLAEYKHLDEQHQVYAAIIADGDRKVGRILDAISDLKLQDRTLVIFSSDNGPEWTGPENSKQMRGGLGTYYSVGDTGGRRGRKRSLFQGGVNSPFIVRWPGHAPAGATDTTTVLSAVDLLPTLCAAADVLLPAGYAPDGEDMLAAFHGHARQRTTPMFWQWRGNDLEPDWWPRLAVRQGDWKLVMAPRNDRAELYNLAGDPGERRDVSSAHPDQVVRLSQSALAWQATLPDSPAPGCISKQSALQSSPPGNTP